MLTTNQIRKVSDFSPSVPFDCRSSISQTFPLYGLLFVFLSQDLSSPSQYDTGVALTGLSCFVTPDLARDLANDIMTLVSMERICPVFLCSSFCHIFSLPFSVFLHLVFAVKFALLLPL